MKSSALIFIALLLALTLSLRVQEGLHSHVESQTSTSLASMIEGASKETLATAEKINAQIDAENGAGCWPTGTFTFLCIGNHCCNGCGKVLNFCQ